MTSKWKKKVAAPIENLSPEPVLPVETSGYMTETPFVDSSHTVAPNSPIIEPAKKPSHPLAVPLAEMLYYTRDSSGLAFDNISEWEKTNWYAQAQHVLVCLDKMNMMVVPTRDLQAERLSNKQQIILVIHSFLDNLNRPRIKPEEFPIEELAVRIMEGRLV